MSRVFGALFVGVVVFWVATSLGIPVWREWTPGDAVDCGLLSFWAAILLTNKRGGS